MPAVLLRVGEHEVVAVERRARKTPANLGRRQRPARRHQQVVVVHGDDARVVGLHEIVELHAHGAEDALERQPQRPERVRMEAQPAIRRGADIDRRRKRHRHTLAQAPADLEPSFVGRAHAYAPHGRIAAGEDALVHQVLEACEIHRQIRVGNRQHVGLLVVEDRWLALRPRDHPPAQLPDVESDAIRQVQMHVAHLDLDDV